MFSDFFYFESSSDPSFELNRLCDTIWISNGFQMSKDYIVIGEGPGADIPPIPIGVTVVNYDYLDYYNYFWIYDDKVNMGFEEEFSMATVKYVAQNTDHNPLSGFSIKTNNQIEISETFAGNDNFYYSHFLSPVNDSTEVCFFNGTDTLQQDFVYIMPGDTMVIGGIFDIPDSITISGYCTLQNASSHGGSYLFLEPKNQHLPYSIFPNANENGYFDISIPSGIYRKDLLHDGFEPVINVEFSAYISDETINIELIENENIINIINSDFSQTVADGHYYCFADVDIPENTNVLIEENTAFYFPTNSTWNVDGSLQVNGTAESQVSFISLLNPEPHLFLNISGSSSDILFENCVFNNLDTVIKADDNSIVMSNVDFSNNNIAYNGYNSSLLIESGKVMGDAENKNYFIGSDGSNIHFSDINFEMSNPVSLYGNSRSYFNRCFIENCDPAYIYNNGDLYADYSVFYNNEYAIIGEFFESTCHINHCTFFENYSCFLFESIQNKYYNSNTVIDMTNSLFSDNNFTIWFQYNNVYNVDQRPEGNIYHTLFNCNYCVSPHTFKYNTALSILDTVNSNNDPCDIYYNIFMDPLLKDDLHLTWNSPCINAGDPNAPKDPDSTITDMGAYFYDLTALIDEVKRTNPVSVNSYPNPATEIVTFDISHQKGVSGTAIITLYNLNGVPVATNYQELPPSESITRCIMPLKNRGLATGVYVYTIEITGQETLGGKLMVVK